MSSLIKAIRKVTHRVYFSCFKNIYGINTELVFDRPKKSKIEKRDYQLITRTLPDTPSWSGGNDQSEGGARTGYFIPWA